MNWITDQETIANMFNEKLVFNKIYDWRKRWLSLSIPKL